ncbi:drug/metabolite transporter (DMT)-like permease [Mycobacterium frederiksbergense]|uniref:Drug/metabolite transporter (DMT)-like permease n=1 Tax=Mycolicibacterium frederiksbergense TaxID=117567 RepID=A0ABT6KVP3_9MYCO|nr:DMT family transporter [Mycolicibacterium frederiksbergense]MDH6194050.1 drug/metabolite transporter (DMT)-like permease [Mycolicibacterium frederiksbergense]
MADLALLGMAAAWGSSYLAAKTVATSANSFGFLALRFAIATAALAAVLAPRLRGLQRDEVIFGSAFGCILAVIFGLETFGLVHTTASNAGLIISLTIVMTPLLSAVAGGDDPPPLFYGAAAIAVAGVGFLTQGNGLCLPTTGDLLILAAAIVRAVHVIVIDRACRTRPMDTGRLTLMQLATSLIAFTLIAQFGSSGLIATAATMSTQSWMLTVYLALVCTVFAFVIQMWGVRKTSATRVSLLLGTEPFFAAAIGISLTSQPLTLATGIGATLVLVGTSWGRRIDNRRTPAEGSSCTTVDASNSFGA